jgi:hypothetical protein
MIPLQTRLVREVKLLDLFSRFIKSIERGLGKNQLHEWTKNYEMNSLSIINLSLEIGYYSTTLSNHSIIRLVRLVLKVKV